MTTTTIRTTDMSFPVQIGEPYRTHEHGERRAYLVFFAAPAED